MSLRCSREPLSRIWIRRPSIALFLILQFSPCAQDEDRKPSPFPDKEREREATAKKGAAVARRKRAAVAHPRTETADRAAPAAPQGGSFGKACFFAFKRDRAPTASGVDADADDLVAAHATYPFGSTVMVTNLANGKTVEVRITDRLPDPRRIISVSEAAARRLGFYDAGTADVKVEPVRPTDARR